MKKRARILAGILILSLAFTACQAVDKDNKFEMPSEELATLGQIQTIEATRETRKETMPADGAAAGEPLSVPYQYGNRQDSIKSGNFMDYGDSVLFWALSGGKLLLYTVNKDTLEVRFVCEDASCSHDSDRCIAYAKGQNLEQYDGKIYTTNGLAEGEIQQLKGDHFETVVTGDVSCFWHANGNLYVVTADHGLLCYERGSRRAKTLMDEYVGYGSVVCGNYIYGTSKEFDVFRVDLSAENQTQEILVKNAVARIDVAAGAFYYVSLDDNCLYACDENYQNPVKLTEDGIHWASLNYDEDYIYMRPLKNGDFWGEGSREICRMPKSRLGTLETLAEVPEGCVWSIYTVPGYDKLFVQVGIPLEGNRTELVYYAVSKDGSEIVKLELPEV